MGGINTNLGLCIRVDASGNVYTTGQFTGVVDMDPGPSVVSFTSAGVEDIYVSKLDVSGNYVWAKQIGGTSYDYAYSLVLDAASNVYVSGAFKTSGLDVDPGPSVYTVSPSGINFDGFVLKLDASGNFGWFRQFGGASFDTYVNDISLDPASRLCITGKYSGTIDIDPGVGTYTLGSAGLGDAFIGKLNTAGNLIWAKSVGGAGDDEGVSVQQGTDGDIYTTGTFSLSGDFDPGAGSFSLTSAGNIDIFACKLDSSGAFAWAGAMGGSQMDRPQSIAIDQSQSLLITGYFGSTNADFNPGVGTFTMAAQFTSDAYVVKLCQAPDPPSALNGATLVCSGTANQYTIAPAIGAATYTWSWPAGWSGIQNSNSATITAGNTSGNITVIALNSCGPAAPVSLSITVNISPTVTVNSGSICSGGLFVITPSGANSYSVTGNNFTVSPLNNSSYSVTGTSTAGCVSLNTAVCNVTVNPIPTIAVNSGSICTGNSFVILPSGAFTYSVSGNNFTVSPNTDTSYSVTGTSSAGCVAGNTAVCNVSVNITPTVSVNSGSICSGSTFTILPSGAFSYSVTGNNFTVSPGVSSSYSVTGTSSAGCVSSNTAVANVTVSPSPTISVNSGNICSGGTFVIQPAGAASYTVTGNSFTVNPPSTSSYSVTGTSTAGCVSVNTAVCNVTVTPFPTITVNSGSICSGNSFVIVPNGANSYTVTGNNFTVNPVSNISYSVTGSTSGCVGTNTAVCNVTVNPTPSVTASTSNSFICFLPVQQSATLTAAGAGSYTWAPGGAGVTLVVSPTVTTDYTVTGSDANGCMAFAVVTQSVVDCTGIKETAFNHQSDFFIYPNPFSRSVFIQSSSSVQIYIYNSLGQLVYDTKISSGVTELNIEGPAGMYYIRGGSIQFKVIKSN
jgi:hypothetical protein